MQAVGVLDAQRCCAAAVTGQQAVKAPAVADVPGVNGHAVRMTMGQASKARTHDNDDVHQRITSKPSAAALQPAPPPALVWQSPLLPPPIAYIVEKKRQRDTAWSPCEVHSLRVCGLKLRRSIDEGSVRERAC